MVYANENQNYEEIELDKEEELLLQKKRRKKKKIKKIFVKIISHLFAIALTIFIALSAFSIVSYCWKDTTTQEKVVSDYSLHKENFYYGEGFDEGMIDKMSNFIKTLPVSINNTFNKDWVVVLDKKIPADLASSIVIVKNNDYDTSGLVLGGYTFTQSRIIYVNANLNNETMYEAFVHEIGHFISFEYGSKHGSKEWQQIYEKGRSTLDTNEYDKSNEAEFFAGCFMLYQMHPEKLNVYLKEATDYFDNLIIRTDMREDNFWAKYIVGIENSINTLQLYVKKYFPA